ncbi:MAG: acetyltransferase [Planctomycetaceae bacterium]
MNQKETQGRFSTQLRTALIWGGRGHAKVLHEFLDAVGFAVKAVYDNDDQVDSPLPGIPVYHGTSRLETWAQSFGNTERPAGFIAIGGSAGKARLEILALLAASGIDAPTVFHPASFVARDAKFGSACQVLASAAVCADTSFGNACIVNTAASVDHECRVGDGVHIAPNATVAGCVEIDDRAFIGAGAVVLPRISIGHDAIVGAGAVVTRNIPAGAVAYGNPARVMRSNNDIPDISRACHAA